MFMQKLKRKEKKRNGMCSGEWNNHINLVRNKYDVKEN